MAALLACRAANPVPCSFGGGGGQENTYCHYTSNCDAGQQKAICIYEAGIAECTCYLNSLVAGTCSSAWSDGEACNMATGCCADVLGSVPE